MGTVSDYREHKPDPRRVQSRCRVDCSCGWRGSVAGTFGQSQPAWAEHYYENYRSWLASTGREKP